MNTTEIKEKIILEISKTEKTIIEFAEMSEPITPDNAIGRISRMDAINNKSVTEEALRQAKNKLENLKKMFSKINDPDFGLCLKCRQSIPIGRLLIRPESLYCINCAK